MTLMKNPRPERKARSEHAKKFDLAISKRGFADAAELLLSGFSEAALKILRTEYQIKWEAPPVGGYVSLRDLVSGFDQQVAGLGQPSLKALQARNTLAALRDVVALVEGVDEEAESDTDILTAKLVICATRLGYWAGHAGLAGAGVWDDFADAKSKLFRVGSGQRGRQAEWQSAFLSRAQGFCEGKPKVSLGQLCVLARTWGEEERRAGRNPGLPSSDDGIKAGLRRMEASGSLQIPGRAR